VVLIENPAFVDIGHARCFCRRWWIKARQLFESSLDMDYLAAVLRGMVEDVGVSQFPSSAATKRFRGDARRLVEKDAVRPLFVLVLVPPCRQGLVILNALHHVSE